MSLFRTLVHLLLAVAILIQPLASAGAAMLDVSAVMQVSGKVTAHCRHGAALVAVGQTHVRAQNACSCNKSGCHGKCVEHKYCKQVCATASNTWVSVSSRSWQPPREILHRIDVRTMVGMLALPPPVPPPQLISI